MDYQFHIHHDLRLVYKKVRGTYGDAESRISHVEWDAICEESPVVGDYNELQDLTGVTDYRVSLDQIRALAAKYEQDWQTGSRVPKLMAYVVPSPLAFGTGRVYGSLMGMTGITFRVFNALDEATGWLGLTEEQCKQVLVPD